MNFLTIKLAVIIGLVVALVSGYGYWHHKVDNEGYQRANNEWVAKEANIKDQAEAELQQKNEEIRIKQMSIDDSSKKIEDLNKESDNEKTAFANLRAQYASGIKRMSVPRSDGSDNSAGQNKSTGAPSRINQNSVAVPEFAATIIDLARGYSENMRLKNECIDLYENIRLKVNGEKP